MANEQRMRPRKRRKVCAFCVDKVTSIDYKDTAKLRRYLTRAEYDSLKRLPLLPQTDKDGRYKLANSADHKSGLAQ